MTPCLGDVKRYGGFYAGGGEMFRNQGNQVQILLKVKYGPKSNGIDTIRKQKK
jgi:hypothetical protein